MFGSNRTIFLGRVENITENGENAAYKYFLLFPRYFQKASGVDKTWDCVVKGLFDLMKETASILH